MNNNGNVAPEHEKNLFFPDPGDLTMDELKIQLENVDRVPLWQMHPVAQNALCCFAHYCPNDVEGMIGTSIKWQPLLIPVFRMHFRSFRLAPGKFDEKFVREYTLFNSWQHRNNNCQI